MQLEEINLGDLLKIIKAISPTAGSLDDFGKGSMVIVRTENAGVHYGRLVTRSCGDAVLEKARRIWKWEGAFTLSEMANNGLSDGKISEPVERYLIRQVIEVVPCRETAQKSIENIKPFQP